jgi:uncharacterized Ntn-hydrolase superfamily protein
MQNRGQPAIRIFATNHGFCCGFCLLASQNIKNSISQGTTAMQRLAMGLILFGLGVVGWSTREIAADSHSPRNAICEHEVIANTFSIVAYDPETKTWGIAVASRVLAVGAVVPHAKAGAGAVATQSWTNVTYGAEGLELLAKGKTAEETIKALTEADKQREFRQVGIVDTKGNPAHFTGKKCNSWAGAKSGKNFTCQGNLLTGKEVVEEMAKAFEADPKLPLAWRLQDALEAGEKAGGDKRGKQSASILVVRRGSGPNGFGDRFIDLRVDDHEKPVQELTRLLGKRIKRPATRDKE